MATDDDLSTLARTRPPYTPQELAHLERLRTATAGLFDELEVTLARAQRGAWTKGARADLIAARACLRTLRGVFDDEQRVAEEQLRQALEALAPKESRWRRIRN